MSRKEVTFRLVGIAPLIVHNGQTADPLNPFAIRLKEVSKKRVKTLEDYERMDRIEFEAGLYMNADGPYIPADNIDSMLLNAAKKLREGPAAKAGLIARDMRLEYAGPRDVQGLWEEVPRRYKVAVVVRGAKVMRMRPLFREWSGSVTLEFEATLVNLSQLSEWMNVAGTQIGLGDRRPRYGRFEASIVK